MRPVASLSLALACVLMAGACSREPERSFLKPPQTIGSSDASESAGKMPESSPIPESVLIHVPFTTQAPFADWNDPYQEACEEASVLMVHYYLNQQPFSQQIADEEILRLVAWERENGYKDDVALDELSAIIEQYFGYDTVVLDNPTIEDIEATVAAGNPVIVPAAGRMLGNPYFSGEGPWYHMLVISGYTSSQFITNDPGTRRGEEYRYDKDVLMSSIHDWTGIKEETGNGVPRVLIMFPD